MEVNTMAKTVIGVFRTHDNVEASITELKDLGYDTKELSVVMKDYRKNTKAHSKGAHVIEGAATGATTGAILGGLAGLLTGIGAIAIPGIGALFIAGPIATALGLTGAAAATGALAGGLLGSLVSLGIPEKEARVYEEYIRAGGILLIVPTRTLREDEVIDIMNGHSAVDIKTLELPRDAKAFGRADREDREETYHDVSRYAHHAPHH